MAVPVFAAAKRLCERAGWSLSNLQLQKLLYIAHMFYLGKTEGHPLLYEHFEAWDYGPVQPDLYRFARIFGSSPIENIFHLVGDLPDGSPEATMIDSTVSQIGSDSPSRLVAITHWDKGAWARNYRPGARRIIIPNEDILREYRERVNAAAAARQA
jgi:uncharacterized phage-associated protein